MFISFLLPFVDRGSGPLYRWVMLAQMDRFGVDEIAFIGDERYFKEEDIPFEKTLSVSGVVFTVPSLEQFRKFKKIALNRQQCGVDGGSQLDVFNTLLTVRVEPLVEQINEATRQLLGDKRPEAFLTWSNCPSLSKAAKMLGVRVIHNENGPLRSPSYVNTVYFDFNGVNGSSTPSGWSCIDDLRSQMADASLLEGHEVRMLLAMEQVKPCIKNDIKRIGVALQVEDDSNIVAYANGWNSLKLIYEAAQRANEASVLIRSHPNAHFIYRGGIGEVDTSRDAIDFLSKIDTLVSINSSLLSEALFWGVPFSAYGDCPVRVFSEEDVLGSLNEHDYKLAMNALFIGYLVPEPFLFSPSYYRWRLEKDRTLSECYLYHLEYLRGIRKETLAIPAKNKKYQENEFDSTAKGNESWLKNQEIGKKISALENALAEMKAHLRDRNEAVAWLEAQRVSLESELEARGHALTELRDYVASREEAVAWLESWRASTQEELDRREQVIAELRDYVASREEAVANLEWQLRMNKEEAEANIRSIEEQLASVRGLGVIKAMEWAGLVQWPGNEEKS